MIIDRDIKLFKELFIGNPMRILNNAICSILVVEMRKVANNVNKESIENYVKECKKRVKETTGRELHMRVPFLKEATEAEWKDAVHNSWRFTWMNKSQFSITPTKEDKEIEELFHTFPIGGYDI